MDGLDRVHLDRLRARGALPTFERVAREGVVVDLATTHPILSPIIWTTVASGYPGEVHGVGGWTSAAGRPFTSADVRTQRLWDRVDAAGGRSLVAGWLMTWPAGPTTGTVVSDKLVWSFPLDKDPDDASVAVALARGQDPWGLAWPPDDTDALLARIPSEAELVAGPLGAQVAAFGAPFHPVRRDETQVRVFEDRWDATHDLGLVYLVSADQVSHLYWPFVDPRAQRVLRADPTARRTAAAADRSRPGRRAHPLAQAPLSGEDLAEGAAQVDAVYAWLDDALARILARVDPATTTVLVLSDHGFEASRSQPALHGSHRETAVLMAWGAGVRPGGEDTATVLDVAPTVAALLDLPAARDHPGRVLTGLVDAAAGPPLDTWTLPRIAVQPAAPADDPATARMLQQLEALGYVDELGAPVLGASRAAHE